MAEPDIDLGKIPVLPQVLATIISLDDESDLSFEELDKIIRVDQSVSSILLRVANSPLYARNSTVKSLHMAISILGYKMVRSLVVLASTRSIFAAGKFKKFRQYVWEHSLVTAIIARELCRRTGDRSLAEEAFIGGLLHDIGKVILNGHDRNKFIESLNLAVAESIPFYEAEQHVFGFDHHQVGLMAVEKWGLPASFARYVAHHENLTPEAESINSDGLLGAVARADYIARKTGFGHSYRTSAQEEEHLAKLYPLSAEDADYFINVFPQELPQHDFYKFSMGIV